MKQLSLQAEAREGKTTRGQLRQYRESKKIPAVVYGGKKPPISIVVGERELRGAMGEGGANAVLTLKHAKGTDTVIVKEISHDVVTHRPLHVDFQRISLKEKVQVEVHVRLIGEAHGVKNQGGILEHLLREIEVECLPTEIPQEIAIDVSALELHHGIQVKDLKVPAGVKVLQDPDQVVVNILAPRVEEEAAPAEGEAAAEPEVIAKGKKEEEGEGEKAEGAKAEKAEKPKAAEKEKK